MSWSQSKRRACGGPRRSGTRANAEERALPFRWARILSISPVVRHSLFNAAVRRLDDDLDLTGTALAGLNVDVKYPFQPLHPGHRLVALGGRLVQPVFPGVLAWLATLLASAAKKFPQKNFRKNFSLALSPVSLRVHGFTLPRLGPIPSPDPDPQIPFPDPRFGPPIGIEFSEPWPRCWTFDR